MGRRPGPLYRDDPRGFILTHVERDEAGCWIWTGYTTQDGYGTFYDRHARTVRAHRASYEAFVGPIPAGLQLDHLCRVRNCVNPEHLEAVTGKVNTLRGIGPTAVNAVKTHCPQGHAYDDENTYAGGGDRKCRECSAVARRRHKERLKARNAGDGVTCDRCSLFAPWSVADFDDDLMPITRWFSCNRHLAAVMRDADWSLDAVEVRYVEPEIAEQSL